MAYVIQPNLGGLGVTDNGGIYTTYGPVNSAFWSGGANIQNAISSTSSGSPDLLFENDLLTITGYLSGTGNNTANNIYLTVKSSGHTSRVSIFKRFSRDGLYLWFAYDDDNQIGTWGVDYADSGYYQSGSNTNNNTTDLEFYTVIKGSPFITYLWTSVPAISGKNGILLPLSTLNDVNNGEEITTSDTSKFSLTEASNVAKLVGNIINAQG